MLVTIGPILFEKSQNSFSLNMFGTTASQAIFSVSGEGFDIAALVSASATKNKKIKPSQLKNHPQNVFTIFLTNFLSKCCVEKVKNSIFQQNFHYFLKSETVMCRVRLDKKKPGNSIKLIDFTQYCKM